MEKLDLTYICRMVSELSGVPVRLYENGVRTAFFSPVTLKTDPFQICEAEADKVTEPIGCLTTRQDCLYGILNADGNRIVMGPASEIPPPERVLRETAFLCDVPKTETASFIASMRAIMPMSKENLFAALLPYNYILNGEKRELFDLMINRSEQDAIKKQVERRRTERLYDTQQAATHATVEVERALTDIVRRGDTEALRQWTASAPTVRSGILAGDQLRQMRNILIVTATLVSRAAVAGGMDPGEAYAVSDAYIQRVEKLTSQNAITNLQFHMITEFTERVESLHSTAGENKLLLAVANYIRHHLSEPVRTERIAKELFLSRTYLSARFREETGKTLTDFILEEKTSEAKRLLRYSDRSVSAIAAYLGFSSSGHFSRVFKKYAGISPGEYRSRQF